MEIGGEEYSNILLWFLWIGYGLILYWAVRLAPWRRLAEAEQLHVFLGTCLVLILLWHLRVQVVAGLSFHILGLTTMTLMFGWGLSILGSGLVLLAVTINTGGDLAQLPLNALTTCLVPVTLTQVLLVLVRTWLPKHFFVYVLVNAFLTAGIVSIVSGYVAVAMMVSSGVVAYEALRQTFLPIFPLIFLPEAILNGWITTILISFRPQWVGSFSDELYLKGK